MFRKSDSFLYETKENQEYSDWMCANHDRSNLQYVKLSGTIRTLRFDHDGARTSVDIFYNEMDENCETIKLILSEADFIKGDEVISDYRWQIHVSDIERANELINIIELYEPFHDEKSRVMHFLEDNLVQSLEGFNEQIKTLPQAMPDSYRRMLTVFFEDMSKIKLTTDESNEKKNNSEKPMTLEEYQKTVLQLSPEKLTAVEEVKNDNNDITPAKVDVCFTEDLISPLSDNESELSSDESDFESYHYDEEEELKRALDDSASACRRR